MSSPENGQSSISNTKVAGINLRASSPLVQGLDQTIRMVLGLYIFSLPFSGFLFIERNGFILVVALMTIWCAVNRRHFFSRTPIDLPLAAFVVWVGFSVPFSASPAYSFGEFAKLLQQGLVFYGVVYFLRSSKHRLWMMVLLLGSLAATSLYGLWQFDTSETREYAFIQSFLGSEVALTTYLIMILPLSAAVAILAPIPWLMGIGIGASLLSVVCQLLTFSRAGMVALFVEAIALAGMVRNRMVTIVVITMLVVSLTGVGVLLYVDDQSKLPFLPVKTKLTTYNLVSRWKAWKLGFEKIVEHPVFGSGYGKNMFKQFSQPYLCAEAEVPMAEGTHNTLVDISVGAGVPAGLAYLWLKWTIGRTGLTQMRTENDHYVRIWSLALFLMVGGVFVRNNFDHMWVGTMAVQFWVLVGLSMSAPIEHEAESRRG
jgi:putative inorganic carbon (HCO3(-)) transporter